MGMLWYMLGVMGFHGNVVHGYSVVWYMLGVMGFCGNMVHGYAVV